MDNMTLTPTTPRPLVRWTCLCVMLYNNLCLFFLPFSSLSVFRLIFSSSVDFLLHLFSTSPSFFSFSLSRSHIRSLLLSSVHQLSWHLFSPLHLFYHPALFHTLSSLILTCEGTCGSWTDRFCSLWLTLMTFLPPRSSAASTEVHSRSNFFEYFPATNKRQMSEKGGRWCDRWWKYNEKNIDLQNQTNESRPSSASAI